MREDVTQDLDRPNKVEEPKKKWFFCETVSIFHVKQQYIFNDTFFLATNCLYVFSA